MNRQEQPDPSGNILQPIDIHQSVNTQGGTYISGSVDTDGGDFIGRDKNIYIGSIKIPHWLLFTLTASIMVITIIVVGIAYQFLPPSAMPDGNFNIAVAELSAFNEHGKQINSKESVDRAKSIAKFLTNQEDALTTVIGQQVLIWGPDQGVKPIIPGTEKETAATLKADVLIYGSLHQIDDNQWLFQPRFYLTDLAVGQADELRGEYAFGSEILYRTQSTASTKDLNITLQNRIEALAEMLVGLSYLASGFPKEYDRAIETFQKVASESTWGKANDNTGQEILYHFLGNSYLVRATAYEDSSLERKPMLEKSKQAFMAALKLNPIYVRSYNGLGAADFQIARSLEGLDKCNWDWSLLDEAEQAFQKALKSPDEQKPISGFVDLRSHFGIGRVHHIRGICPLNGIPETEQEWNKAQNHYQIMLDQFQQISEPFAQLMNVAAYAHADLGIEALIQAQFRITGEIRESESESSELLQDSIQHFQQVIILNQKAKTTESVDHSIAVMPFYLNALCTNRQGNLAKSVLSEFLTNLPQKVNIINTNVAQAKILDVFEKLDVVLPINWEECTK